MEAGHNASYGEPSSSTEPPAVTLSQKEQTKIEFYRTYDAMTGIRIAATLGGFFGLMVILVVYKSKSKTEKALEDPKLCAAAVAEAEAEEERQIHAALEATVFQQLNPRGARRSLDISSPLGWHGSRRFSAIGGYSSLIEPPIRTSSRLPCFVDEDSPEDDRTEFDDVLTYNRHLEVPRRPSNITCSSSDSSYLERRGSAVILGLPAVPAHKSYDRRRQSSPLPEQYDFYYPIDIRVIQPTPGGTPCGSERALYDNVPAQNLSPRRAPLASISSCNSSLLTDYPDFDAQSLISMDSVFHEDEYADTEDEVDPFSTDSESESSSQGAWCKKDSKRGKRRLSSDTKAEERRLNWIEKRRINNRHSFSFSEKRPNFRDKRKLSLNERRKSSISDKMTSIIEKAASDDEKNEHSNKFSSENKPTINESKAESKWPPFLQNVPKNSEDFNLGVEKPHTSRSNSSVSDIKSKLTEENSFPSQRRVSLNENTLSFENSVIEIGRDNKSITPTATEFHTLSLPNEAPCCHKPSTSQSATSLTVSSDASQTVTLPTLPLVERTSSNLKQEGSWSQETLF